MRYGHLNGKIIDSVDGEPISDFIISVEVPKDFQVSEMHGKSEPDSFAENTEVEIRTRWISALNRSVCYPFARCNDTF